jgi:hypothetical protein
MLESEPTGVGAFEHLTAARRGRFRTSSARAVSEGPAERDRAGGWPGDHRVAQVSRWRSGWPRRVLVVLDRDPWRGGVGRQVDDPNGAVAAVRDGVGSRVWHRARIGIRIRPRAWVSVCSHLDTPLLKAAPVHSHPGAENARCPPAMIGRNLGMTRPRPSYALVSKNFLMVEPL